MLFYVFVKDIFIIGRNVIKKGYKKVRFFLLARSYVRRRLTSVFFEADLIGKTGVTFYTPPLRLRISKLESCLCRNW